MFSLMTVFVAAASTPPPTRSIALAWVGAASPDVAGYVVYYGTASGNYPHSIFSKQPAVTIAGLVPRTTYYFVVTATSSQGYESEPSNEISYTVPAPPDGTFNGLFYEADAVRTNSTGIFSVSITPKNTFSGRLQIGTSRCAFSGQLDSFGNATTIIQRRGNTPLTLTLNAGDSAQSGHLSGRLTDGTWTADLSGDRAVPAKTASAFAGNYTLVVPPPEPNPPAPAGDSWGTVKIAANGLARFVGALADGTRISQSVPVSMEGLWPLYVALYKGGGLITGWLSLTNSDDSDVNGAVTWIKPPDPKSRYYPAGLTCESFAIGSRYIPAARNVLVMPDPDCFVSFSGGDLVSDFTNTIVLALGNRVLNRSANGLSMSFSVATGAFSGKVRDPDTAALFSFSGVVLPKFGIGRGFLLGTNESSAVRVSP